LVTLSAKWHELVENLQLQSPRLKKFVLDELEVPQGRGGEAVNVIDPRLILNRAAGASSQFQVSPLDPKYFSNFWETRFTPLRQAKGYEKLAEALSAEQAALREYVAAVSAVLTRWGYDLALATEAVTKFLGDVVEVHKARQDGKLVVVNDPEFDQLYRTKTLTSRAPTWATAYEQAKGVVDDADPFKVALFDPRALLELEAALADCDRYLKQILKEVEESEAEFAASGDPHLLSAELLQALDSLTTVQPEEPSDGEASGVEGAA
jgi:hypothetical protein